MKQKNIIQMLTGVNKLARKSKEIVKKSSADYIEDNVMRGKYVLREEYQQLQKLVFKLQQEIDLLKK